MNVDNQASFLPVTGGKKKKKKKEQENETFSNELKCFWGEMLPIFLSNAVPQKLSKSCHFSFFLPS